MKKQITAAAAAAAALLATGCASTQHPAASSGASPAPAGTSEASTTARAAISRACKARLSAWRPTGQRFGHMLLHDARAAGADLQSFLAQARAGIQLSRLGAALTDDSARLASTAKQMLDQHLPPPCVPHLRAELAAALRDFEKQAADVGNASLALAGSNPTGAQRLLKAASRDITAGATGISRATADSNNYQG